MAVVAGYLLLLTASLMYLDMPWKYVVASLILIKGLIFWMVINRAAHIGGRRNPPQA